MGSFGLESASMVAVEKSFLASWNEMQCSLGPGLGCVISALPVRCRSGRVMEAVEVTDRRAVTDGSLPPLFT